MLWLIAALLSMSLAHEPHLQEFAPGSPNPINPRWGTPLKTETFTAGDKALQVSYPYQLNKLPGSYWLVPSHMGVKVFDADFAADFRPISYHFPGATDSGRHLLAPFVIRAGDGNAFTLIAVTHPIDDISVHVSRGRVAFGYPRVPPGGSLTITHYTRTFSSWQAAVDQARQLYGLDDEDDRLYRMFWRPGYLNAGLMNATDATLDDGFPLVGYYQRDLHQLLGWVQYWGQMSPYLGGCCTRTLGFHARYENPAGLVPLHGEVGYYARTGDGESLVFYDEMVELLRAQGHASVIYWDIVGMSRTVEPAEIVRRAQEIPTFIEGASCDLPLASMVGHSTLAHPNAFTELGRYFLRQRPLFAGYANVGDRDRTLAVYRDCIELGMGFDAWFFYDEEINALLTGALREQQRVGFWADRPQLVRRGEFQGASGKTYRVTLDGTTTTIGVTAPE